MNVLTLPLGSYQTNCYILWNEGSDRCLVIDPGYPVPALDAALSKHGLTPEAILLTHGHFDHVGGVENLARRTGCKVYLHQQELTMPPELTAGPLYYTDTYGEGSKLTLAGLTFTVLHTPGHTKGSVCLLFPGIIFAGDTLFAGSCGRTDLFGGSWSEMRTSLARLAALPGDYAVYPGHGGSTTLDAERKYNPYLRG